MVAVAPILLGSFAGEGLRRLTGAAWDRIAKSASGLNIGATGAPQFVADGTADYLNPEEGGSDNEWPGPSYPPYVQEWINQGLIDPETGAVRSDRSDQILAPQIGLPMPRILPGVTTPGVSEPVSGAVTSTVTAEPFFSPGNPNQPVNPFSFPRTTLANVTGAFSDPMAGRSFSDPIAGRSLIPDTMGLVGARSTALINEAARLEMEAGKFSLGELANAKKRQFGLARERLEERRIARRGEAEAMLNRSRVGGSTLALAALGSVDAQFAEEAKALEVSEAESVAQSRLQEIEVKNELYTRASQARIQAVQSSIDDLFKTADIGLKDASLRIQAADIGLKEASLRVQAAESRDRLMAAFAAIEGEITRTQMQIAASEAQSIRDNITRLKVGREANEASERINEKKIDFEADKGIGQALSGVIEPTITQVGRSLSDWIFGNDTNSGWTDINGTSYRGGYPAGL